MKGKFIISILAFALSPSLLLAERPSFTTLQQQIDALNARINQLEESPGVPIAVDASGDPVGRVVGSESMSRFNVLSDTGYLSYIIDGDMQSRQFDAFFFELPDCVGASYFLGSPDPGVVFVENIFDISGNLISSETKYVPISGPVQTTITYSSLWNDIDGFCLNFGSPVTVDIDVNLANDPAVTGFLDTYTPPIMMR